MCGLTIRPLPFSTNTARKIRKSARRESGTGLCFCRENRNNGLLPFLQDSQQTVIKAQGASLR
nr:MAG TPA: hypothetical protein [Caudoviricetes sp.]